MASSRARITCMLCNETAEGSAGTGAIGSGLSGAVSCAPEETDPNEEKGVSDGGTSAMTGGATGGVVVIRCNKIDEGSPFGGGVAALRGSPLVGVAALRGLDVDRARRPGSVLVFGLGFGLSSGDSLDRDRSWAACASIRSGLDESTCLRL